MHIKLISGFETPSASHTLIAGRLGSARAISELLSNIRGMYCDYMSHENGTTLKNNTIIFLVLNSGMQYPI